MSMILCTCPAVTFIPTITPATCKPKIGQIQKIAFQRKYSTGVERNTIASLLAVQTEGTWTDLLGAVDGTKVQISPFISDAKITAGDKITVGGGDNSTPDAIALLIGSGASTFDGFFRSEDQLVIQEIREYQCEVLQVYFFNQAGQIIAELNTDDTKYQGFPIEALFIGDISNEGYADTDKNMIDFQLRPAWANRLKVINPLFNALDLANA